LYKIDHLLFTSSCFITHADGIRGIRVFTAVFMSGFPHYISKTDAATGAGTYSADTAKAVSLFQVAWLSL